VLSLSSCLKDPRYVDFSKVGTLIELPLAAFTGPGKLAPEALPITSTPQTFNLIVNVAAPKPLSTAVKVTFKLDVDTMTRLNAKLLATFNTDSTAYVNDTTGNVAAPAPLIQYALPPSNAYSIASLTTTIPANQRTGALPIVVTTSNYSLTAHYVIPLTIIDASGQKISNYRTIFLNVQAKNKWDGIYTIKGFVHRDADATLGGPIKAGLTSSLATTGANSVSFDQIWASGSEAGGINLLSLDIDPVSNAVTISSGVNATLHNLPGYTSHYDPATKTFFLGLIWNGTDPNHRSAIDTLTYKGVR